MSKPALRSYIAAQADFRAGKDSPSAFLDRCLATLAEIEPQVLAFVHYDIAAAREAASRSTARWKDGKPLSPLDGMPVGVKDIIETRDFPTENGSAFFKGWHANRDAASVTALREAGAIILGKTVTTEFATAPPGPTRNPWDVRRTPGGSSSGSAAATAAGMIAAGLGTQVLGSILRPASFCGCVGFKPSLGAINRSGSHDGLSQSVHGALAASIEDAWVVLREIADRAGGDPDYPGLFGPAAPPAAQQPRSLAVLEGPGWSKAAPEAIAALDAALARLSAAGVRLLRRKDSAALEAAEVALLRAMPVSQQINAFESRWALKSYRATDPSKITAFSLERLAEAERITLDQYRARRAERSAIRTVYAALAGECDAAITISATGPAPLGLQSTGDSIFVVAGSVLGVPAISLPLLTVDGLPLGLQLLGFLDRDAEMIATARWVQSALGGKA
jgi:Asp-tRNA(Asn)/Glu-tRNA(Gln) amidotransferase A subunit family amidase